MNRFKHRVALVLLRLSIAFTWLGYVCFKAEEKLVPPEHKKIPAPIPDRGPIDSFTLELVAWRGGDGENQAAKVLTSLQAERVRSAWKGRVTS